MARVTNALVTWDDLALMSLTQKTTPPTGKGIANKGELNTYYYVNNAISPFSGYTNDRCPPYQTISGVFGGTVSWAPGACAACNAPSGSVVVAGNNTTFCNSTTFTSGSFASWASGNYVLALGGNAINISTNGTTTATMYGGGCQTCPTTTPSWTYVYDTCVSCVTYAVYRDANSCSATYLYYKIGSGGTPQVGAPSNGACNTTASWTLTGGYVYYCNSGVITSDAVYRDLGGSCSPTYGLYRIGTGGTPQSSNPAMPYPNTDQVWVDSGSPYCGGDLCLYQHQIQTNPCAVGNVRDIPVGDCPNAACATQYALTPCAGGGTSYSYNLAIGTFSIGQIVEDGSGNYYTVSAAGAPGSGGIAVSASLLSSCPTLYTLFSGCYSNYYLVGAYGYSGKGYSTSGSASGDCLTVVGTSTSPSGIEVFDWYSDPFCSCV